MQNGAGKTMTKVSPDTCVLRKVGFALTMPDAPAAALQQVGLAGISNVP